jgi:tight adherence protein C
MLITLVAVFVSVALLAGIVTSTVLTSASVERRRLRAVTGRGLETAPFPEAITLSTDKKPDVWQRIAPMLGLGKRELERLRIKLVRAGYDHAGAPVVYTFFERIGPLIVGAIPLVVLTPVSTRTLMAAGAAAMGMFFAPGLIVDHGLAKRRRAIENGLADALDLMVVCIEAGCGLDQAIVKSSDELGVAYPVLANEFRILISEIRAGKPRVEAFKALAQRTKVDDIRALVAMLVQTDRFGTSIGQALRTHADVSRDKRRQRAEEKAQKIAVKLVFPLVLCFFPAFYVVVLGPAVIQFVRSFVH